MIVTFYSFKGGVGRSMALANIGAWLYLQGRRVLLVDWDLEAPGLESFFLHGSTDLDSIRAKPGLVDLIESYRQLWRHCSSSEGESTNADKAASLTEKLGAIRHLFNPLADTPNDAISTRQPGIWLLHAGCRAGASEAFYRRSVHSLDWGRFYEEYGGYFFIEWLRRELEKHVDFVLVDSRTGVTEMGGVCTQHLADAVILMFAPNDSNLEGAKQIAKLLVAEELKDLRGSSRPLTIFPIPARVDTQGATTHLEDFEKKFRVAFQGLSDVSLDWCWESKLRYVTSYSYQESVLVLEDVGHSDLRFAYERIGDHILRLQEEKLSPSEREYRTRSRSTPRQTGLEVTIDRSRETIQQLISTARAKMDAGDFSTASSLLTSALALAEKDLGRDDPDTLSAMNNLAASLFAQRDLDGARSVQERVLEVGRRVLGEEHPNTLTSMNNLASTLWDQGDLSGARTLQERALEVSRRVLGEEHPNTLTLMNNLAETLRAQGDLRGARALNEQVLEVSRRVLGEEHPNTLTSMNNLAGTLQAQGDLSGARTLQELALEVSRRVLGEEHPNTLASMANLAVTLQAQGDLSGARTLQERALEVSRRVLGEEHPNTLTLMNNLAETLRAQGDLPGARALHERELEVCRRVLGEQHPDTLTSMNGLAETLRAQDDLPGARALHEQVLEVRRRVLGEQHPDTTKAAFGLMLIAHKQGDAHRINSLIQSSPPALAARLKEWLKSQDKAAESTPR